VRNKQCLVQEPPLGNHTTDLDLEKVDPSMAGRGRKNGNIVVGRNFEGDTRDPNDAVLPDLVKFQLVSIW
jgi:hypothetical protein